MEWILIWESIEKSMCANKNSKACHISVVAMCTSVWSWMCLIVDALYIFYSWFVMKSFCIRTFVWNEERFDGNGMWSAWNGLTTKKTAYFVDVLPRCNQSNGVTKMSSVLINVGKFTKACDGDFSGIHAKNVLLMKFLIYFGGNGDDEFCSSCDGDFYNLLFIFTWYEFSNCVTFCDRWPHAHTHIKTKF